MNSGDGYASKELTSYEEDLSGWEKARRTALHRDGYSCVFCGDEEDLEVHHVVPKRVHGSNHPENLLTTCTTCHGVLESATRRIVRELHIKPRPRVLMRLREGGLKSGTTTSMFDEDLKELLSY